MFVTHLESAIDGTKLPANQLHTMHQGRPLWVRYDLPAVKRAARREDLRGRAPSLWRYRELLPLPQGAEPVTLGEGMSPLLPCPRLGKEMGLSSLFIKDESQLPTGSFKSRGMAVASEYPAPPPRTGDRRLLVEGVPVRVRLVVVGPTGSAEDRLDLDRLDKILERVVPGLGEVFKEDRPRVKEWPRQVSYQGFATHFFHSMIVPEEEGELTPWVLVAGRVKLKEFQMMLGLALLALKPTTIGQRTLDAHEWESTLRVRMRD